MVVVSAAHGVFGPLMGKLAAMLARECGRLKGVRREIRSLKSELTSMHAALKVYTELEYPNDQVKAWISLVRELAYDTEDVFDKFIHHLGTNHDHGGFKEFFRKTARRLKTLVSRRGIAVEIVALKNRIKQVKELKESYRLNDASSSSTCHAAIDPRLHAIFVDEAHLVGVDGPRDDLTKWMVKEGNNSSRHRKVLSIVGFGGLGKTTLANEVYRKIQGRFQCSAFVSVSQKPDIKKIIKDVISQVSCQDGSTKDTSDWDENKSISKLKELLQDKMYLIVIDDIWSTQAWNTIKCAFPENTCSSRIITTTRIVDVAKSCCSDADDRIYELEALSDIHSRSLFFKRIFGTKELCPDILKDISNKILKKCGGLPLAIISISGILANRPANKEEWQKVERSIGSTLENNKSLEGMNSILSLSYNDLSPNLKTCLLYLSVFPEDCVIERERLVRRWIAEGFISEERGQSRLDVAENSFYELINKSMIQPMHIDRDGKALACRVHDMLLEILISKSAEDNFVTVIDKDCMSLANHHDFIRRLSIQHIDQEFSSELANKDLSHVRSLTVATSDCIKHLPSLTKFEALRVLDFAGCQGLDEYDMTGVEKLFQLKYLNLRNTGVLDIPSGVVKLRDIETLHFGNKLSPEPLGSRFRKQTERLCLLRDILKRAGTGNSHPRNIQMVSGINVTRSPIHVLEELGNRTSLNELHVQLDFQDFELYKGELLLSSLCKLSCCKLQFLEITCTGFACDIPRSIPGGYREFLHSWSAVPLSLKIFHMSGRYYLTSIPEWISPELTRLAYLCINLTELTEEALHTFGKLPALLFLKIVLKTRPEDSITVQGSGFPSLKEFDIFVMDGAYLMFVEGAMPKLENLSLVLNVSVAKKHGFDLGIGHLPCLKQAKVRFYNVGGASSDWKAAAAAVRNESDSHPNHPTVSYEESTDCRLMRSMYGPH